MSLLCAPDGEVLARLMLRDDDGEQVATRVTPVALPLAAVVAQARHDLAGLRLDTPDDDLLAALLADGLMSKRASTTLRHDLVGLSEPAALPAGWSWLHAGWDEDLARALEAAYAPGHPDGRWTPGDTEAVREMVEQGRPVPALVPASARVVGPDGRSAGHVLTAGPVPWTQDECGWVLDLAVAPLSQGRGLDGLFSTGPYTAPGRRACRRWISRSWTADRLGGCTTPPVSESSSAFCRYPYPADQ